MTTETEPDFTIGMAAFKNFDEVYFTVQALRFFNVETIKRFEIVVVDNCPDSKDGEAIKALIEGRVRDRGRYVPFPEPKGSVPPRGHLFDIARGKFVVCIDSHVFLAPGALDALVKFFDENPDCDDLLHGPLLSNYGPHRIEGTHMNPRWRSAMFGTWGKDSRGEDADGEPFEIPQHGLGLFAARRESWLRFHPDFAGFSGGEGYIHEKYRQAGRRVLCLPGVRWYHKFSRPHGIPHRPTVEDKIRNHVRGWMELGVDLQTRSTDDPIESIAEHYVGRGLVSAERFSGLVAEAGFPGYIVKEPGSLESKGAVVGPSSWGSFCMRGRPLAEKFGFRVIQSRAKINLAEDERFDTALVVKSEVPKLIRERSSRVIAEPLDLWFQSNRELDKTPAKFLADFYARNKFDDLIVSTIPMKKAAGRGIPKGVRVHLVPHHADARVGRDWHDPDGPIVYAGHRDFVAPAVEAIKAAAERLGREVVFDYHPELAFRALKGASLCLAPRLGRAGRKQLNREGKPTVKIANAAQARVPLLTTDDPSITTLFPDVRSAPADDWLDEVKIAGLMGKALDDEATAVQFSFDRWLERMRGIVCGS